MRTSLSLLSIALFGLASIPSVSAAPLYDHVVVVVLENRGYSQIVGSAQAPYINSLASGGALFTNSYGLSHPSQPNYLQLFSGSNQGVTDSTTPASQFNTPNLGGQLIASGRTFVGYSESLPFVGYNGDNFGGDDGYWRKHNPWVNFSDVPVASNRPFTDFPSSFAALPTVSFIVPNQANDMHNGTVAQGDAWLLANVAAYASWAGSHNSLLILTFDEDDRTENNHIATIFYGANIVPGVYGESITHYNVLRTIEDIYQLPYAGNAATASTIASPFASDVNTPEPGSMGLAALGLLTIFARRRDS